MKAKDAKQLGPAKALKVKRLKALQEEISNTELDILTRFKGRHDLVNVILGGGKIADLDFDGLAAPADPPPDEA